jgi:phosphoenolpyruvate---glycerone phosphotransferase subunit DhaL
VTHRPSGASRLATRRAPALGRTAAADAGVQAPIPMKSKMGRTAGIAERSVGHQDPGATSFSLMWKSAAQYLTE